MFLITNRNLVDDKKYYETIKKASYCGVENIILREKDLSDEDYEEIYKKVVKIVKPGTNVIIHSKLNILRKVNSNIIHLTYKDFLELKDKENLKIGVSVHSVEEGIEAYINGASYILASHIFNTKCKEGLAPKGLGLLKNLRKKVKCKIVALGGINEDNYKEILLSGADDFAVMSLLFKTHNIDRTIYKLQGGYMEKLKTYLITDSNILSGRNFYSCIEDALKAGIKVIQLREKDCLGKEFLEKAYKLRELTKKYNALLIINDRVDIALIVDADGVHVGQKDIPANEVRKIIGKDKIVGVSARSVEQAQRAKYDGADYIGVGAMFTTSTKLDAKHVSFVELQKIKDLVDIPIICIGGITLENKCELDKFGVKGFAVVSAILEKEDIYEESKKWIES